MQGQDLLEWAEVSSREYFQLRRAQEAEVRLLLVQSSPPTNLVSRSLSFSLGLVTGDLSMGHEKLLCR